MERKRYATIDGKDAILEYAKNSHEGRLSDMAFSSPFQA